jgi:phosphoribosylformimino-5-aminoimidazole carboxamide ribotide isomerase
MQLIPAIDLLGGNVVRLHQGDFEKVTVFSIDPLAYAKSLQNKVERLHVVDLEGARTGLPTQNDMIAQLCESFGPGVQVGGGIRTRQRAKELLAIGVSRVVFGTSAIRDPDMVRELAAQYPGRVIVGVDARDGLVTISGWLEGTSQPAQQVAQSFSNVPIDSLLFTDVSRDGTRVGPAVESTIALAEHTSMTVLASGGVGTLEDLRALTRRKPTRGHVLGVIVGRALLDGEFSVDDAMEALA